ncbi:hypothetical protein L1994_01280 [Methanomicrobium antiquum]|uniref:Uncharacterized protein n=1 Tax=Methanomicrobium antiquum TaxID=487686 RepID=A0AAF0FP59_9EURY|nr:hypothetical protein [Methanomicrobium antiquum]WFN37057.1 hypothetical protein L1994_01280 [Methanomicrobium antiquum]
MTRDEINKILNAAARVIIQKGSINILFEKENVKIKLPTTRELAKEIGTPHYYVLPGFSRMEEEKFVTREERVGIWTTNGGTKILLSILETEFSEETKKILGANIFNLLTEK